jgi:hypothetical protein
MTEPTLFGVGKAQWELINSFGSWLSAIGSIAAAGIALYLANRASNPSARVTVRHRLVVGSGIVEPFPQFVVFTLVNTGDRPIRVSQIGWEVGMFRKQYAMQLFDAILSSPLPIELTHGQEASWLVALTYADQDPWADRFSKDFISKYQRLSLWTLRGIFSTSVGHVFSAKPDKNILKLLREAYKKS